MSRKGQVYKPIGNRQRVLEYISHYWREYHGSPSIRDISRGTKIGSTSYISFILDALEQRGELVPRDGGLSRQITPIWVKDAIDKAQSETH